MGDLPHSRRLFLTAGLWFLLFVVYGSLVPLDFHPETAAVTWHEFLKTPYYHLGLEARADWVANLLLYIPLGFCFTAALSGHDGRPAGLAAALAVFFVCVSVAIGVEFTQLFFPPRTVSLNDIVAEVVGSAVGIVLARTVGDRIARLVDAMRLGGALAIRAAVTAYVLGYLALSLFPFDFILDSAEFAWKLRNGMYGAFIAPGACDGIVSCGVKLAAEVLAVAPLGLLLGMMRGEGRRGGYFRAAVLGCVLGAVIEGGQFMIASGISQGMSILTRGAGLALGLAAHDVAAAVGLDRVRRYLRPVVVAGFVPYVALLMAVNGWFAAPWSDAATALANVAAVKFVPFHYHYFTTESVALRSFLLYVAAYLPVGLGCWMWRAAAGSAVRRDRWVAAALAAALAFVMEVGKLFVPEKKPDPTDVLIAGFAAYWACAIASTVQAWSRAAPTAPPVAPRRALHRTDAGVHDHGRLAARILSLPLLAAVSTYLLLHPYGAALAVLLAACAAWTWRWPAAALPAALALLPLLDLSPLTGWIYVGEFDAVLMVTVAVLLWRIPSAHWSARGAGIPVWLMVLLVASYAISAVIGLLPLQPIDLNAFASYYSHYNSLRTLKGFCWALLLAPPLIQQLRSGVAGQRTFTAGVLAGLLGVGLATVWERHLFPGVFDFSADYRVTATFFEMHVGGAYLEAYLVLTIPFLLTWAHLKRGPAAIAGTVALFALASYALLVTFSRGGYLGYVGALAILGVPAVTHALRNRRLLGRTVLVSGLLLATGAALVIPVVKGSYMQSRWAAVRQDAEIRAEHWRNAIAAMTGGPRAMLFGMGLGRFPEAYFFRRPSGKASGTYRYMREDGNVYLRLGAGETMYYGQRVAIRPGRDYEIELDMRSKSDHAQLSVAVCEKSILYSHTCRELTLPAKETKNRWTHFSTEFKSGEIGSGSWYRRRPVEFALSNSEAGTLIDVDNVVLRDRAEAGNLVRNGDFSRGHDYWFFAPDNHQPWHVFNLAVQVFFEQGAFGLIAIGLALAYGLARLGQGVARGDPLSGVFLAALVAFLLVGLFDSLFDSPRLTLLFFLWLFLSAAEPWRSTEYWTAGTRRPPVRPF